LLKHEKNANEKTHLRPQEVVAPSEHHAYRSRRILRVPSLLDRSHDVVHPPTISCCESDETFQFWVGEVEGGVFDLKGEIGGFS